MPWLFLVLGRAWGGADPVPAGPFRAECRFIARDGHVVWVHGEARVVLDAQGRPQFLQGVAFDITDIKRAQDVLVTEAVRNAKLEEELAIARRVQTSIVPHRAGMSGARVEGHAPRAGFRG